MGKKAVEDVIDEDPMLQEETIVTLIVNELADAGHIIVPEMVDEIKI